MRPARAILTVQNDNGCQLVISHRLNQDGYFRKRWGTSRGHSTFEMFLRFIYRAHFGEIPDGFEIAHTCGARACCNPKHLRALPREEHLFITNRLRYRERYLSARSLWEQSGRSMTGAELGRRFGVSSSAAYRWVKRWTTKKPRRVNTIT